MVPAEPRVRPELAGKPRFDKPHFHEGGQLNIDPRVVVKDAACSALLQSFSDVDMWDAHLDKVTITVTKVASSSQISKLPSLCVGEKSAVPLGGRLRSGEAGRGVTKGQSGANSAAPA